MSTVPRKTRVTLCAFFLESPVFLRFPRTRAYASALQPEAMWTGPPPAKSSEGSWERVVSRDFSGAECQALSHTLNSQPLGFHVQHAIGQYTMVAQRKPNTMEGTMQPRSKA